MLLLIDRTRLTPTAASPGVRPVCGRVLLTGTFWELVLRRLVSRFLLSMCLFSVISDDRSWIEFFGLVSLVVSVFRREMLFSLLVFCWLSSRRCCCFSPLRARGVSYARKDKSIGPLSD
jgi:hypothetical protein